MSLLPLSSNSLIKRLPLLRTREKSIRYLIYGQLAFYGFYVTNNGPLKMFQEHATVVSRSSAITSVLYFHFANYNLPALLFNSGVIYTLGNYHVLKYGQNHFLRLLGIVAAGGALAALQSSYSSDTFRAEGGFDLSGGLIAYHVFKNPAWFSYGLHPFAALSLLVLLYANYGERAGFGGLGAGYLAYLLAL